MYFTNLLPYKKTSSILFFLEQQCHRVFNNQHISTGIRYYLSQYHGLIIKTLLVRYRRWGLTLIVFLLPILNNLLSNIISHSHNESGIFQMNLNSLNPQTILYNTDPTTEKYFRASINGAILEKNSGNISQMNRDILRKFTIIKKNESSFFVCYFRKTYGSSIYIYRYLSCFQYSKTN
jgi:hypothetical protein